MVYNILNDKIPARIFQIPSRMCKKAVKLPARKPAKNPARIATSHGTPVCIAIAVAAAPVTKLPSTVKSGKFKIRKVKKTPSTTSAYSKPSSTDVKSIPTIMSTP